MNEIYDPILINEQTVFGVETSLSLKTPFDKTIYYKTTSCETLYDKAYYETPPQKKSYLLYVVVFLFFIVLLIIFVNKPVVKTDTTYEDWFRYNWTRMVPIVNIYDDY